MFNINLFSVSRIILKLKLIHLDTFAVKFVPLKSCNGDRTN